MKYLLRFFLAVLVFATLVTFSQARPAKAAGCVVLDVIGPASGFVQVIQGHVYATYFNGVFISRFVATVTMIAPYSIIPGHLVRIDESISCGGPAAVNVAAVFFNPGDGRVAPLPGDRLAVYCNINANPPTLDVWGITNDSNGHRLFTFNYAVLAAAGKKGVLRNVGQLGSLSAIVDANNNFFVQWFGGPAGATGDKDFAKSFTCDFKR